MFRQIGTMRFLTLFLDRVKKSPELLNSIENWKTEQDLEMFQVALKIHGIIEKCGVNSWRFSSMAEE